MVIKKNKKLFIAIKSDIPEPTHRSLIKMLILEERFKWHLDAFAYKLFKYKYYMKTLNKKM